MKRKEPWSRYTTKFELARTHCDPPDLPPVRTTMPPNCSYQSSCTHDTTCSCLHHPSHSLSTPGDGILKKKDVARTHAHLHGLFNYTLFSVKPTAHSPYIIRLSRHSLRTFISASPYWPRTPPYHDLEQFEFPKNAPMMPIIFRWYLVAHALRALTDCGGDGGDGDDPHLIVTVDLTRPVSAMHTERQRLLLWLGRLGALLRANGSTGGGGGGVGSAASYQTIAWSLNYLRCLAHSFRLVDLSVLPPAPSDLLLTTVAHLHQNEYRRGPQLRGICKRVNCLATDQCLTLHEALKRRHDDYVQVLEFMNVDLATAPTTTSKTPNGYFDWTHNIYNHYAPSFAHLIQLRPHHRPSADSIDRAFTVGRRITDAIWIQYIKPRLSRTTVAEPLVPSIPFLLGLLVQKSRMASEILRNTAPSTCVPSTMNSSDVHTSELTDTPEELIITRRHRRCRRYRDQPPSAPRRSQRRTAHLAPAASTSMIFAKPTLRDSPASATATANGLQIEPLSFPGDTPLISRFDIITGTNASISAGTASHDTVPTDFTIPTLALDTSSGPHPSHSPSPAMRPSHSPSSGAHPSHSPSPTTHPSHSSSSASISWDLPMSLAHLVSQTPLSYPTGPVADEPWVPYDHTDLLLRGTLQSTEYMTDDLIMDRIVDSWFASAVPSHRLPRAPPDDRYHHTLHNDLRSHNAERTHDM